MNKERRNKKMNNKGSIMVEAALYFPIVIMVVTLIIFLNLVLLTTAGTKAAAREVAVDICENIERGSYSGTCTGNLNADNKNSMKPDYGVALSMYHSRFYSMLSDYGVLSGAAFKSDVSIHNGPIPLVIVEGSYVVNVPVFVGKMFNVKNQGEITISRSATEYARAVEPSNLVRTTDTLRALDVQTTWNSSGERMSKEEFIGHVQHAMAHE